VVDVGGGGLVGPDVGRGVEGMGVLVTIGVMGRSVLVGVGVAVGGDVLVGKGVFVGGCVLVGVAVLVGVGVAVYVAVGVKVGAGVAVSRGVGSGVDCCGAASTARLAVNRLNKATRPSTLSTWIGLLVLLMVPLWRSRLPACWLYGGQRLSSGSELR
jgi:hypothetical protein